MDLLVLVLIVFIILRLVFPFILVGSMLNDASQVSEQEYLEVAVLLKQHPKLKSAVDKAMADRIITKNELSELRTEVSRMTVDEAIKDVGSMDSH